ncbi:MAG: DNA starvation/stationary phase protection protein [Clostridia bacterium]|nr:DNA starvation/stationary phase protection protein [Clostridia bacterium]
MEEVNNNLNQLLADLNVFFRKLQNYHWNIEGRDFFIFHKVLEEFYDCIFEEIDEIAEHILINGAQPLGTLKDYLQITKIKEAENKKVSSNTIFTNLISDYDNLLNTIVKIKESADNAKDYATSSLMDEYILKYSKKLWMLKQGK